MTTTPETREEYSAKIPALQVLCNLGWTYIPPGECLAKRESARDVLLKDELIRFLKGRTFEWAGREHRLSNDGVRQIVRELSSPAMHKGLLSANQDIYNTLTLGVTVTEFLEDGTEVHPTIAVVDWKHPDNNRFHVTEEFEVQSAGGTHKRIPDLACFVNGIPLAVIEAKRPESGNPNKNMVDEGVSQSIRNQGQDEIPHLFAYTQLLLAVSNTEGRYGTTMTPRKFWGIWKDEEFGQQHIQAVKNATLAPEVMDALFAERSRKMRAYFEELWSKPVLPTAQDTLLVGLLSRERLLEMIRYFILFDQKVGKIVARYQQVFGIKAMLARVKQHDAKGARLGGVIWHTTGSGKSFTMVFFSKALLLEPELADCRIFVVTDRVDLEKQLSQVFTTGGAYGASTVAQSDGDSAKAKTGIDLARRIGQSDERIIFTIVNKFATASGYEECRNTSDKIIVLVDEGHRSHGGETHERMRQALPNAAYIAFTGTPLLKEDKTQSKFGPIIHAYTMQRAVEDGTVTRLLYEERMPELDVNAKAMDNWFDKITSTLSEKQKADLKRKFSDKGTIHTSEGRIELIAWDIAAHFNDHVKGLKKGLKGQVATSSKREAIRYKKYLDQTGLVTSAVVISPPDTREGHDEVDQKDLPEVQQWYKDNVGKSSDGHEYERSVVEAFATDGEPDLLIVVSKLLTGFDEPRNTALYIDKSLREHELLQAIARVNRLHEDKAYGLLIDYRGILQELDTTLDKYQDLQERTQGGYEIDDLEGLYRKVDTEYKKLPALHDKLWAIFAGVENKADLEQYRQVLMPNLEQDEDGNDIDTRLKVREDFYQALTEFGLCLKVALASHSFFEDGSFGEALITRYKNDLRFFTHLRKIARQDAMETVDYSAYEEQIRNLVDKHVVGVGVKEPEGVILIDEMNLHQDPEKWTKEKTKNETDTIRTRVKKTINQDLGDDPYAQKVLSQLLKEAIEAAERMFDHPHKQYTLFKEFEERVAKRTVPGIPDALKDNETARAVYGTFRLVMGDEHFKSLKPEKEMELVEEARAVDEIVTNAMAENSLNQQSMEAAITKGLLPRLFKLIGLDKAKEIIETILQITRIRLARAKG